MSLLQIFLACLFVMYASPACNHPIFCSQQILTAVAKSSFYQDSKTFVDLVLKVPVELALQTFKTKPIEDFLKECFTEADTILDPIQLPDYTKFPTPLKNIKGQRLTSYALDLNHRWKSLARKVNLSPANSTCNSSECSSFIWEMNGKTIIIPGGRFRQAYYWDSYWIVKGLITCELFQTAENLIRNFLTMVSRYGFVPNGFRVYFLNRSQPPFLALMIKDLSQAYRKGGESKKADQLERDAYPLLVSEHSFWMNTHAKNVVINGKQFKMNVYNADTETPRPESYKQDAELVKQLSDSQAKKVLKEISTMAESGWDFSSRWFKDKKSLKQAFITQIIPSDLNTIMGLCEKYLADLSQKYKQTDKKKYFEQQVQERKNFFLQTKEGDIYPDFSTIKFQQKRDIYPSDLYPHLLFGTKLTQNPFKDLVNPASSQTQNGQQWDKPNVWAPNNWILHEVLPQQEAFKVAEQWVKTTYCSWRNDFAIYEKYRNDEWGKRGQGGQYVVQTGFGWSNGLTLHYLSLYGAHLNDPTC